jgi:hypothetical protein
VDSQRIHLAGNEWVKEWIPLRTTRCKRGPLLTDTSNETLVGTVKLGEATKKPCSDVLAHILKVCKGILLDQWVPNYQG